MVGRKGLEPSHLAALEPKSSVSTNSTTGPLKLAFMVIKIKNNREIKKNHFFLHILNID